MRNIYDYFMESITLTRSFLIHFEQVGIYQALRSYDIEKTLKNKKINKYYKNLAGIKDKENDDIVLKSLDTDEEVVITKDNIDEHPLTKKELLKYEDFYISLINKYPKDKTYIDGILNGLDLDYVITVPDCKILSYRKDLINENEIDLIENIETFLKEYQLAYYNKFYNIDELFISGYLTNLFLILPIKIISYRLENRFSDSVHDFHLYNKLSSFSYLREENLNKFTKESLIWLYSRLNRLKKTLGDNKTFEAIFRTFLDMNGIGSYRILVESKKHKILTENFYDYNKPFYEREYKIKAQPYNKSTIEKYRLDLLKLLHKDYNQNFIKENEYSLETMYDELNKKLKNIKLNDFVTKDFLIEAPDIKFLYFTTLFALMFNNVLYSIKNSKFDFKVEYRNITDGKIIKLNAKGFILYILNLLAILTKKNPDKVKINEILIEGIIDRNKTVDELIEGTLNREQAKSIAENLIKIVKEYAEPNSFKAITNNIGVSKKLFLAFLMHISNSNDVLLASDIKLMLNRLLKEDKFILDNSKSIKQLLTENIGKDIEINPQLAKTSLIDIINRILNLNVLEIEVINKYITSYIEVLKNFKSYTLKLKYIDDYKRTIYLSLTSILIGYNQRSLIKINKAYYKNLNPKALVDSVTTPFKDNKLNDSVYFNVGFDKSHNPYIESEAYIFDRDKLYLTKDMIMTRLKSEDIIRSTSINEITRFFQGYLDAKFLDTYVEKYLNYVDKISEFDDINLVKYTMEDKYKDKVDRVISVKDQLLVENKYQNLEIEDNKKLSLVTDANVIEEKNLYAIKYIIPNKYKSKTDYKQFIDDYRDKTTYINYKIDNVKDVVYEYEYLEDKNDKAKIDPNTEKPVIYQKGVIIKTIDDKKCLIISQSVKKEIDENLLRNEYDLDIIKYLEDNEFKEFLKDIQDGEINDKKILKCLGYNKPVRIKYLTDDRYKSDSAVVDLNIVRLIKKQDKKKRYSIELETVEGISEITNDIIVSENVIYPKYSAYVNLYAINEKTKIHDRDIANVDIYKDEIRNLSTDLGLMEPVDFNILVPDSLYRKAKYNILSIDKKEQLIKRDITKIEVEKEKTGKVETKSYIYELNNNTIALDNLYKKYSTNLSNSSTKETKSISKSDKDNTAIYSKTISKIDTDRDMVDDDYLHISIDPIYEKHTSDLKVLYNSVKPKVEENSYINYEAYTKEIDEIDTERDMVDNDYMHISIDPLYKKSKETNSIKAIDDKSKVKNIDNPKTINIKNKDKNNNFIVNDTVDIDSLILITDDEIKPKSKADIKKNTSLKDNSLKRYDINNIDYDLKKVNKLDTDINMINLSSIRYFTYNKVIEKEQHKTIVINKRENLNQNKSLGNVNKNNADKPKVIDLEDVFEDNETVVDIIKD